MFESSAATEVKKPQLLTLDLGAIPWASRLAEWAQRLPFSEEHRGCPLRLKGFFGGAFG